MSSQPRQLRAVIYRGYYTAAWGYEMLSLSAVSISQDEKIKFVCPSGHVMSCLFYRY